jgi:hypothetical protein
VDDPDCRHLSHYECMSCRKMACARCGAEMAAASLHWKAGYWCSDCPRHIPALKMKRTDVFAQIEGELLRAAEKWGGPSSDDRLDRLTWLRLIDEHRIRATRHGTGSDEYRHELVVIAALVIAAIEAHDRRDDESDLVK